MRIPNNLTRFAARGLVSALICMPVVGQASSAIVLASYSSAAGAEQRRSELTESLHRPLLISAVTVNGRVYYRVQTESLNDVAKVRDILAEVKRQGLGDAWIHHQPDEQPEHLPNMVSALTGTAEPRDRTDPDQPPYPATPPATSPAKTLPVAPSSTAAASSRPQPMRLARIRMDDLSQVLNIQSVDADEVPATEIPIDLPKFANVRIVVDGRLDEPIWSEIPGYDNMRVIEPDTLLRPANRTINKIFYTDEGLYVGVMAEQDKDTLIVQLSSRDKILNRDGTTLSLDPSGEGRYGFFFAINLGGSMEDGTILPENQFSREWDGAWYGSAVETEYGYSTEMFIPWSIIAMPEGTNLRKMGIYVSRKVANLDERWAWPTIPFTRGRFMSVLQPIQLKDVKPSKQLTFYPFTASTYNNIRSQSDYRVGMDVFWRPSTNMQLSATLNPDFGAVESDDVVVNLTAFETFFPEKRLFFLEGSDVFVTSPRSNIRMMSRSGGARRSVSTYIPEPTTLVNTRRIGGPAPTPEIPEGVYVAAVELGKPTELIGAAKVTGQFGGLRYGVMAAAEDDTHFYGTLDDGSPARVKQDGRDFAVVRLLYEEVSHKGRRSLGLLSTLVAHPTQDAMTHGVDAHYVNQPGNVTVDGQLMYSDVAGIKGYGGFLDIRYIQKRGLFHTLALDYIDERLDVTDFGFIRRNDVKGFRYGITYMGSNVGVFRRVLSFVNIGRDSNGDGHVTRTGLFVRNNLTMQDQSEIGLGFAYFPRVWDDRTSEGNGSYLIGEKAMVDLSYGTNSSLPVSASVAVAMVKEDLGTWLSNTRVGITWKPTRRVSFDLDLGYRKRDRWLLHLSGPTFATYKADDLRHRVAMDVFLTAKQQLRFTLQWAGIKTHAVQLYELRDGEDELSHVSDVSNDDYDFTISRITTQLRYRWEIAPLSDLFLVYTRGSNLPNQVDDSFNNLFRDSLTNPVVDMFVAKLRYRFGR